jgi:heptosyltransferase-2
LGIALGASRPTKSWPIERFVEAAKLWKEKTSGGVVVFTGPGEKALADEFKAKLGSTEGVLFEDNMSVRELAAKLSRLSVFLGNDSGPKHIAVALHVPTVTVFGPEHPFEWHPYSKERHPYFFIENLACRRDAMPGMPAWCGLENCVVEGHKCMTQIAAGPVIAECERVARK